jgi:hypothetical protein
MVTLALILGFWGTRGRLTPKRPPPPLPTVEAKPPAPSPAALEEREREALTEAGKGIEADNLDAARDRLKEAVTLNGPLNSEIQRRLKSIEESLSDPNLRQLRLREEKLWQKALKRLEEKRYNDAEMDLRQIRGLPAGGVHRDDAKTYLDQIIPQQARENDLFAQAHMDAAQGEFQEARWDAEQLRKKGNDVSELLAYIDRSEEDKFLQLQAQFNQLKERDSDSAVQQLNSLWPEFEAISDGGGPRSNDAVEYMNKIPEAMHDIQSRMQAKTADASFQRMVQSYQQAIKTNDRDLLTAARNNFQAIVQGGGPHADEARQYLTDLDTKLPSLTQVVVDPGIRDVLARYSKALEHRDADALLQVWPNVKTQLEGYRSWFAKVSSIRVTVSVQGVSFQENGTAALVKAQVVRFKTLIGASTTSDTSFPIFHLARQPDRTWLITGVELH